MDNDNYQQLKKDSQNLAPVSEKAVQVFDQSFSKVLELVNDKSHIVKENLSKCLLKSCMQCRDNCPTHSIRIEFHE